MAPARDLVATPGHYTEASFSPDGTQVVYRAVGGDSIRGGTFGVDPGIYVVAVDGKTAPRLVREGGSEPQFDHTGTRIYFRERRGEKFVLASVNLTGGDEQVHFQSDNATQIVPSPDGKWVAFAERYRAYVAAFPRSGRPVDLGPTVVRLSGRAHLARRRAVSALVGRQPPASIGRSGRSSSRAHSIGRSRS